MANTLGVSAVTSMRLCMRVRTGHVTRAALLYPFSLLLSPPTIIGVATSCTMDIVHAPLAVRVMGVMAMTRFGVWAMHANMSDLCRLGLHPACAVIVV